MIDKAEELEEIMRKDWAELNRQAITNWEALCNEYSRRNKLLFEREKEKNDLLERYKQALQDIIAIFYHAESLYDFNEVYSIAIEALKEAGSQ